MRSSSGSRRRAADKRLAGCRVCRNQRRHVVANRSESIYVLLLGNVSVLGATTNLAARLQTAAEVGEIVLSDEAHRRVATWLADRGLEAFEQALELKGFDGPQPAWRLRAGATQ